MKNSIAGLLILLMTASVNADELPCRWKWQKDRGQHCHHVNQSEARKAVSRGDVLAYSKLETAISAQFKGRIIRVELEEDDGEWVYEVRLLADDGRVIKVWADATHLQILEVEGHRLESVVK